MASSATDLLIWDLYSLDDTLTAAVAKRGPNFYQIGTDVHGKLRNAKRTLDAIQGEDIEPAKNLMRHVTNRLLLEVFTIQDGGDEFDMTPVDPATLPPRPTKMPPRPAPTCVDCGSRNIVVQ
jgi:hypothetical protein